MGVGDQHLAPAALPPGKTRYALYRRLGRPQGRSGRVRKISPPPVFDRWTVQPVASRYTDCAIPAPSLATILTVKARLKLVHNLSSPWRSIAKSSHGQLFLYNQVSGLVPGRIGKELLYEYTGENVHDRESCNKNDKVSQKQLYKNLHVKLPKCNRCQCEKHLAASSMLQNTTLRFMFLFLFLKRPLFCSVTISFRQVV